MKYRNAADILPQNLIEAIQQYTQGTYLYIPVKARQSAVSPTPYHSELEKRDRHIYTMHLEGIPNKLLASMFHLSQSSIRRILSTQRKRFINMEKRIQAVLPQWKIHGLNILQIYDTVWKIGDDLVLKIYQDFTMMDRNVRMITQLERLQIPAGKIIETANATQYAQDDCFYYVLSEKLKGNNLVDLQKDRQLPYKMGQTLAKLHIALRECEKNCACWNNSLLDEINGWVKAAFIKHDWPYISEENFTCTASRLESLFPALPVQLIHRDVHFGNFLFDNGEFSGYVDYDLSQRNIRIFDLCYFLLGLLSEQEKRKITHENWFDAVKSLFSGYRAIAPLSREELMATPYVMLAIELLFVAWFTEENDVRCSENAANIYRFIESHVDNILRALT